MPNRALWAPQQLWQTYLIAKYLAIKAPINSKTYVKLMVLLYNARSISIELGAKPVKTPFLNYLKLTL